MNPLYSHLAQIDNRVLLLPVLNSFDLHLDALLPEIVALAVGSMATGTLLCKISGFMQEIMTYRHILSGVWNQGHFVSFTTGLQPLPPNRSGVVVPYFPIRALLLTEFYCVDVVGGHPKLRNAVGILRIE